MSWYSFRPYVSSAERRRKAKASAKKLSKNGRALAAVQLEGRKIATTFWGKAWCDNLESYSDYANRLPRGRTYVRNGSVIDLQIANGKIEALVQGSDLYKISISIRSLGAKRWEDFKQACAGKLTNLLDLLQGRLSKEILADITAPKTGLFPSPKEITLNCSCPDWAGMCKHLAAVLYGIGARLDAQPEMFFMLRGVEMQDLISAASANAVAPRNGGPAPDSTLSVANLSEIFGVDIEPASELQGAAPPPVQARSPGRGKKLTEKSGAASGQSARKSAANRTSAIEKKPASRRDGKAKATQV